MNRKNLVESIRRIATAQGYNFTSTATSHHAAAASSSPAMWLNPPQFVKMQGRNHGKMTYEVTLHALTNGAKTPPSEYDTHWTKLEGDLIRLFTSLSHEPQVIEIENLKIRNTSHTLASHGTIEATATAEVVTFF